MTRGSLTVEGEVEALPIFTSKGPIRLELPSPAQRTFSKANARKVAK